MLDSVRHNMYIRSLLSAQLTPLRRCLQTIATCKCKRQCEQLAAASFQKVTASDKVMSPSSVDPLYFQSITHNTQQSRGAGYFSAGSVCPSLLTSRSSQPCMHVLIIEEKMTMLPQLTTSKIDQQQYNEVLRLRKAT